MLVRRAFAADDGNEPSEELLAEAYKFFLDYYREHKLDYTYAYEGVLEALDALHKVHDQLDVPPSAPWPCLTNKPVRPAQAICEALGLAPYFLNIYGGNSFATKKPDPEGLLALMKEAGANAEETVMIGDSQVDVQTARNAGAWCIGCTFGLAPGQPRSHPARRPGRLACGLDSRLESCENRFIRVSCLIGLPAAVRAGTAQCSIAVQDRLAAKSAK